ncbi:MAG TPA: arginine--tRNA ligase [Casimicrobiaceae bacterium]|nr:arginine--tRNA ligase [Casimicrobiaceae bacterium]
MSDLRQQLNAWLADAVARALPGAGALAATLERPRDPAHGDFASNAAMVAAKAHRRNPREIAQAIAAALAPNPLVARTDIAGAGFINITLAPAARQQVVARVLAAGDEFGRAGTHRGERVMVEFVSANPTGPLHVGHGRQAVLGDAIASLLEAQGHAVTREFYYNDAGAQIDNLALSVRARIREAQGGSEPFPEDGYRGEYIRELAARYVAEQRGDVADLDAIRRFAVAELRREQDADLRAIGVRFDNFYLESSLYTDGRVERTVAALVASGRTYEEGGALWLRTTDFGDDKDRVMRKSDGSFTYFVPDVAYHVAKFDRGFPKVVNVQGSDHHSTVMRVRAGLQALALGIPQGYPDYVLHKMVRVMKGGEEVKISKRAGSYVTLRDLIDDVGRDAVRYFLVSRKADSEFTFDLDLARSQSEDNPVYYVQYAHARVASVLRQAGIGFHDASESVAGADLALLTSPYETALMRRLDDFPEEVAVAARELAPHRLTGWLKDLSQEFHSYYNAERFLVDDPAQRRARLALAVATGQVIRNGLALLGIAAPLEM